MHSVDRSRRATPWAGKAGTFMGGKREVRSSAPMRWRVEPDLAQNQVQQCSIVSWKVSARHSGDKLVSRSHIWGCGLEKDDLREIGISALG